MVEKNNFKQMTKLLNSADQNKVQCECGHSILMGRNEKTICTWCGKYVYKNKKIEFKNELAKKLKIRLD